MSAPRERIVVESPRLQLVGADSALLHAELAGPAALAAALGAVVPSQWPPEFLDEGAIRWTLAAADEMAADAVWRMYYMLLKGDARTVVGTCGYKIPPDAQGRVEVGYSVVPAWQRHGLATEAVQALMAQAVQHGATEMFAQTLPELVASQRVMQKCGMTLTGPGSESGAIRFAVVLPATA
jgi:RimJ/RimL family protein N-acetyltransferase